VDADDLDGVAGVDDALLDAPGGDGSVKAVVAEPNSTGHLAV
jgi:hypothetical protein